MNSSATLLLISLILASTSIHGLDDEKNGFTDLFLKMLIIFDRRLPGPELPKQYKKYAVDSIASDGSVIIDGRTFKIAGIRCDEMSRKYLKKYLLNPNTSAVYLEADNNGKGEIYLWNVCDSLDKDKSYNKPTDGTTYMSMADVLLIDNVCEPRKDKTFKYYHRYKYLYDLKELVNSKI